MSFIQVTSSELRNRASELQEAKEAFNSAFIKDKSTMDAFKSAIDQYVQALLVIAARYEEAEKKNVSVAATRSY